MTDTFGQTQLLQFVGESGLVHIVLGTVGNNPIKGSNDSFDVRKI